MFTELARRAALNMGEYINAAERYGRLALKAQSNCRATLETLAKLHQPREKIVKHVHVNEGGQAIVADVFHHHAGGHKNAESANQSHAAQTASTSAALPCPDASGNRVPIASGKGETAMQDARRD
jgi:seryl-tRNA(Sec) selenium transferase